MIDKDKLLQDLQSKDDIIADNYDGSYELVREIVASYATLDDYSEVTFRDMNAIYLMAIGTWKINAEKKKEKIGLGCLPDEEKLRLYSVIDKVWNSACEGYYDHKANPKKPTVGMFGTGFYSFENKTTKECAQRFVEMLVDITQESESNAESIFSRTAQVLNGSFKGMKAAAASVVLHCLMPTVFPILNGNPGNDNIYVALGINLEKPAEISTYIANCRKIKAYRDANLSIKNYRVMDVMAWELPKYELEEYYPSLSEYDPNISTDTYVEIFQDESVIKRATLDTVYLIYLMGGEASCKQIANQYGNSYAHYNSNGRIAATAVHSYTNCELSQRDEGGDRYWSILFQGRSTKRGEEGGFVWKLRPELSAAIAQLDEAGFFEGFIVNTEKANFDHNIILYGPPGTGKTYNTAIYAVAICDGKSVDELTDYEAVMERYDELKKQHRIAFTTFHQSYGYEEFIEGIKPVVDGEKDGISYKVEAGVFKKFCESAKIVQNDELEYTGMVWSVRNRAGDKEVEKDFEEKLYREGVIKIEDIDDYYRQCVFLRDMAPGDWVVLGRNNLINAIGVIVDNEPEVIEDGIFHYQRRVEWKAVGLMVDCRSINQGKVFSNFAISRSVMKVQELQVIIDQEAKNTQTCVFIIDEINRGNISKIFGELITLIETTKREGMPEAITATLPYSHEEFSVPSNVYILGTMNTADRSIALMDTALRRRFSFVEMPPRPELLDDVVVSDMGEAVNVGAMLRTINKRIAHLYDREHTIGHAPFMSLMKNPSMENLAGIFAKSIIPLLQEYFYEDYAKIRMVLGDNAKSNEEDQFVVQTVSSWDDDFLGNQPDEVDLPEYTYEVRYENFTNIRCYKGITERL